MRWASQKPGYGSGRTNYSCSPPFTHHTSANQRSRLFWGYYDAEDPACRCWSLVAFCASQIGQSRNGKHLEHLWINLFLHSSNSSPFCFAFFGVSFTKAPKVQCRRPFCALSSDSEMSRNVVPFLALPQEIRLHTCKSSHFLRSLTGTSVVFSVSSLTAAAFRPSFQHQSDTNAPVSSFSPAHIKQGLNGLQTTVSSWDSSSRLTVQRDLRHPLLQERNHHVSPAARRCPASFSSRTRYARNRFPSSLDTCVRSSVSIFPTCSKSHC